MGNLWNKIKLIWKGREIASNLMNIKSKWKEPTFWLAILGQVGTVVGYLKGVLDPKVAIIINAIATSLYNYVRGIQKAETDGVKPYASRSEFILGLGALVQNCFMALHTGGVDPSWLAGTTVVLGHAMTAAGELNNMRPKEVVDAGAATPSEVAAPK